MNMDRWKGKVAVVTGASAGIGAACCTALLNEGMIVVGLARRQERMEKEYKPSLSKDQQSRFHAIKCDVSKENDILSAFKWIEEQLGGVGVLINNAGIICDTHIVDKNNTEDLKALLDVNVLGVALCTREAFQIMKKNDFDGHIILINSVDCCKVMEFSDRIKNLFPATKYAITAMTEVLRQEFLLNKTKIKVTSVSPGVVDTEVAKTFDFEPDMPILQPIDIANAVLYCIQTPPHVQIHELTIKPVGEMLV